MRAGMIAALLLAAAGAGNAAAPTGADLDALRRRVALLETELALSRSRKPYLILDAPARRLRYRLLGLTMREIPLQSVEMSGLRRAGAGGAPGPLTLAGIVTLKEKDGDPRLTPLTPAEIEAGAADENVADALPPEAPAAYALRFKQAVVVRVEGLPEKRTVWTRAASWWRRLRPGAGRGGGRIGMRVALRLEEGMAREVYRSLVPGERLVLVPPEGFLLPDAGQEAPGGVRSGRPVRPPAPRAGPPAEGVPFQIPPPVEPALENGGGPAEGTAPGNGGSPGGSAAPETEGDGDPPAGPAPAATPSPGPVSTPAPAPDDPAPSPAPGAPPAGGRA